MIENFEQIMPKVHFEQIAIKNLVSNQNYQRGLSEQHVQKAVENFDPYQINPVKVSKRNGINYVFNGQHTIEIVATVSGSRETPVWCMIYDDLEYEHEADIFANQQKFVKPLTPYEIFVANIEAGNEEQLTIKGIVESYNLVISPIKTPGGVCAIASIEYIFRKFGYHILDDTIGLCVATWEGDVNSFTANILKGIAKLLVAYGNEIDKNLFKEKLGCCSIREIVRSATERSNGSLGYAEAILTLYNKRLRNPLSYSKLYKKKKIMSPDFVETENSFEEADIFEENSFE
jgi:hypothetical protein